MIDITETNELELITQEGNCITLKKRPGTFEFSSEHVNIVFEQEHMKNGLLLKPQVSVSEVVTVTSLQIINVPVLYGDVRFLRFGLSSPGDPVFFGRMSSRGFDMEIAGRTAWYCEENETQCSVQSTSLIALEPADSPDVYVVGNSTFDYSEGTATLICSRESGEITFSYSMELDGVILTPDKEIYLDPVTIMNGDDLNTLLCSWAEHTGAQTVPRIPEKTPTGWNDWQYYRNEKTQQDVLDSAEVIADLRKQGYPLDFIQVDGGFCLYLSEWSQPQPSFSDGIDILSEKIRDMGLKFGLWFAPYIQNKKTTIVKEHPGWLLRDDNGNAVEPAWSNVGPANLIDYSLNEPCEWLREQVRLFVDKWNVTWIKLDGPQYRYYRAGNLRDKEMTVTRMLARTFDIIREEAGPDVLIEGEGVMGAALGRVDLHRVQQDNHPLWYNTRKDPKEEPVPYAPYVYGKELIMGFLHNRWWCNHRENIILRDFPSPFAFEGGMNPYVYGPVFSNEEFHTQLTAAVIGSGGLLLADPMKELRKYPRRMKWISRVLPVYTEAARIVDTFPDDLYPCSFALDINKPYEQYTVLAVINWEDEIKDVELDMGHIIPFDRAATPHYAFSYFEEQPTGIVTDGIIIKNLPAHSSRLIALRPVQGHPQLISTSLHLLQGAVDLDEVSWDEEEMCLRVSVCHFSQEDEKLFFAVPEEYHMEHIEANATGFVWDDFEAAHPVLRFRGTDEGSTVFSIYWDR